MAYADVILATTGIQSYWRLGEAAGSTSVSDSEPTSPIAGTVTGATLGVSSLLQSDSANTAAFFDGVDDYIGFGDNYGFTGTASFSVELLLNADTLDTTYRRMISKEYYTAAGDEGGWWVAFNSGAGIRFTRDCRGTGGTYDALDSGTTIGGVAINTTDTYHVVVTYDGTTMRMYVNGTETSNRTSSGSVPTTTNPLYLARSGQGGNRYHGVVDEVSIYNVALSAATVTEHYNATLLALQKVYPVSDVANTGNWTRSSDGLTTDLWTMLDDANNASADYIQSVLNPTNATYKTHLGTITVPSDKTNWNLKVGHLKSGPKTVSQIIRFIHNGTTLKTVTLTSGTSEATDTINLDDVASSVTSGSAIDVEIESTAT